MQNEEFRLSTHLKLVEFVRDCKNDWHNFVREQGDFHIDVWFPSIARKERENEMELFR